MLPSTRKSWLLYGIAIAGTAFFLRWLEYQYVVRVFATEIYIVLIAVIFAALGAWVGNRLTRRVAPESFQRNTQALQALDISKRELDVLEHLANGLSNREIAEQLYVSTNTVKTHLGHLYEKLGVSRRTQAVIRAKSLSLIP